MSRLVNNTHIGEQGKIIEEFPDEQLLAIEIEELPWYVNIVNYLVSGVFPPGASSQYKKRLIYEARLYM